MNSRNQIRTRRSLCAARSFWRALLPASRRANGPDAQNLRPWDIRAEAVSLVVLLRASGSFAYSVLTHEETIDLVWTGDRRPLLLDRFPALTEEQTTEAVEASSATASQSIP
jgi:hypothetical protein